MNMAILLVAPLVIFISITVIDINFLQSREMLSFSNLNEAVYNNFKSILFAVAGAALGIHMNRILIEYDRKKTLLDKPEGRGTIFFKKNYTQKKIIVLVRKMKSDKTKMRFAKK